MDLRNSCNDIMSEATEGEVPERQEFYFKRMSSILYGNTEDFLR